MRAGFAAGLIASASRRRRIGFLVRRRERRVVQLIEERRAQLGDPRRDKVRRAGTRCDVAIDVVRLARPFLRDRDLRRIHLGGGVVRTFRQRALDDRPRGVGLSLPQIDGRLGELQRRVVRFFRADVVQLFARGGVVAGEDGAPGIVETFRIRGRRLRVVADARIDEEAVVALRRRGRDDRRRRGSAAGERDRRDEEYRCLRHFVSFTSRIAASNVVVRPS